MAVCWQCAVPQGQFIKHCGHCDCCRPMERPDLHNGGSAGDRSGCVLWTFMIIAFLYMVFIEVFG